MENKNLHIYGQDGWHDDVYIVANRTALEELRLLIEQVLTKNNSQVSENWFICNDGEGYNVGVELLEDEKEFDKLPVPYFGETPREKDENKWQSLWARARKLFERKK